MVYETILRPTFKAINADPNFAFVADKVSNVSSKLSAEASKLSSEASKMASAASEASKSGNLKKD